MSRPATPNTMSQMRTLSVEINAALTNSEQTCAGKIQHVAQSCDKQPASPSQHETPRYRDGHGNIAVKLSALTLFL